MTPHARTASIIAGVAAAVVLGAGAGAGAYALLSDNAELSIGSIYDQTHRGVVEITATTSTRPPVAQEQQQAQGSGWVYDRDGHIVTNKHVVAGADTLSVRFWNGADYRATVVGSVGSPDLAVIEVDAPSSLLHPIEVGNSDPLRVGDDVVVIGNPLGLTETVTRGIVSGLHRELTSVYSAHPTDSIQTDAAINGGNSGSPLLNAQGRLVGVIAPNASVPNENGGNVGINFAITSKVVASIVPRLISRS